VGYKTTFEQYRRKLQHHLSLSQIVTNHQSGHPSAVVDEHQHMVSPPLAVERNQVTEGAAALVNLSTKNYNAS
jgi:hypothetical protein